MILLSSNTGEEILLDSDYNHKGRIHVDTRTGYAKINIKTGHNKYKTTRLHRHVMSAKEGQIVDHINGNKLDNRRENLRFVTERQNQANRRHKGASYDKSIKGVNKWKVTFGVRYVGRYPTEKEAIEAYRKAHVEEYGEFSPYYKYDQGNTKEVN